MRYREKALDEALEILRQWSLSLREAGRISRALLFGSAVLDDGKKFSIARSDIDILLEVEWETSPRQVRVEHMDAILCAKVKLEKSLASIFGRPGDKAIASVVPMTGLEVRSGIHKDANSDILFRTPMLDLIDGGYVPSLCAAPGDNLSGSCASVLRFVQKKRSEFLSANSQGECVPLTPLEGTRVPKELMRNFAISTYNEAEGGDPADLHRGFRELASFGLVATGSHPVELDLSEWLHPRLSEVGDVETTMPRGAYLLCCEKIFDNAQALITTSSAVQIARSVEDGVPQSTGEARFRVEATFRISQSNKLAGTATAITKQILNARLNMLAGQAQPFVILFEEPSDAADLIEAADETLPAKMHKRKIKILERRLQSFALERRIAWGFHKIIFYAGTIWNVGDEELAPLMLRALRAWIEHCYAGFVNIGGRWEAFHAWLYPDIPLTLSFSVSASFRHPAMGSASPVTEIPAAALAESFLPELVSKVRHLCDHQRLNDTREDLDDVFNSSNWLFGWK